MGIAERTVKARRAQLMAKLGIGSAANSAGWPSGCNTCPTDPAGRGHTCICPLGQTALPLLLVSMTARNLLVVAITTVVATFIGHLLMGTEPSFYIPALEVPDFDLFQPLALTLPLFLKRCSRWPRRRRLSCWYRPIRKPAQCLPDTKVGTFTQALYDEATKQGWVVISMKNDWKRIFAFEP